MIFAIILHRNLLHYFSGRCVFAAAFFCSFFPFRRRCVVSGGLAALPGRIVPFSADPRVFISRPLFAAVFAALFGGKWASAAFFQLPCVVGKRATGYAGRSEAASVPLMPFFHVSMCNTPRPYRARVLLAGTGFFPVTALS